jgi:hypothetical protein
MSPQTKLIIIALVSTGSIAWGALDLMRKREETTTSLRVQSWAQVAVGLIGLGFVLSSLAAK